MTTNTITASDLYAQFTVKTRDDGTTEELRDACERNASTDDFLAILDALRMRYGSEQASKVYQRALQDWEFSQWTDEERDVQYPGWRNW